MAPMVTQDSIDLSFLEEDFFQTIDPHLLDHTDGFSFEEIEKIVETCKEYDNTKLMDNNGVNVGLPVPPCAVMVQPASPNPTSDSSQMLQPVSPEMILLQPVSPGLSNESVLSPYSSESFTSDSEYLQPTTPEPYSMQPTSPVQHYSVVTYSTQPSSLESMVLQGAPVPSVEPVLSPYSVLLDIKEEVASLQSLDDAVNAPKKRGRKRKYPEGTAPRRTRPKKTKVYEMGPLPDEMAEKKRKNAINAKKHRDMQKNQRDTLAQQLEVVTAERDSLREKVQQLLQSEAQLRQRLASQVLPNNVML